MKLRKLEMKDAPLMLEWMHDNFVVKDLQTNFAEKTIEDCIAFINAAHDIYHNLHLAIVDDEDTYMGTVSLKNVQRNTAEFAITVRKSAMGKGYSQYGMSEMIRRGIEEMGLTEIYWCVDPMNKRAVHFYDKNGYIRVDASVLKIEGRYSLEQIERYIWYRVKKEAKEE